MLLILKVSSIGKGQQFLHQGETSLLAEQSLPYHRFISELERQLVVTSGLEFLSTKY